MGSAPTSGPRRDILSPLSWFWDSHPGGRLDRPIRAGGGIRTHTVSGLSRRSLTVGTTPANRKGEPRSCTCTLLASHLPPRISKSSTRISALVASTLVPPKLLRASHFDDRRDERIRTSGPLVPNQLLCQTELHLVSHRTEIEAVEQSNDEMRWQNWSRGCEINHTYAPPSGRPFI